MRAPLAALLALCCVRLAGAALQYDYLNVYSCPPSTCLARKCVRRPRRRRRGSRRNRHHWRDAHMSELHAMASFHEGACAMQRG